VTIHRFLITAAGCKNSSSKRKSSGDTFMHKHLLAATLALGLTSSMASAANIVETAMGAGTFNTLIAAAKAAGLADALATGQNLTVFAPTDEAFAKLPAGTVEDLLKPENKAKLAAILTYHVLPRKLTSNQMMAGPFHVRTLKAGSGGDYLLAVKKSASGVTIDNANVIKADIMTDNGVIHVIDSVMLPEN
jgi:uncharacterized surface protein with fasciclin (FAS1) repeats